MDRLHIVLGFFLGVCSCNQNFISASVMEVTVRPGDNTSLYCDCKVSIGVHIVWHRNCIHEDQPSLVLRVKDHFGTKNLRKFPRFIFRRNFSSDSYDLLILNTSTSDEGLYYCGTEEMKLEKNEFIDTYSNITTRLAVIKNAQDNKKCDPMREETQM